MWPTKFMLFIANEFCDFWITRVRDSKLTTASQQQASKRCLGKLVWANPASQFLIALARNLVGGWREGIRPAKKNQWWNLFPFPFSMEYFNTQTQIQLNLSFRVTLGLQGRLWLHWYLRKTEILHAAKSVPLSSFPGTIKRITDVRGVIIYML